MVAVSFYNTIGIESDATGDKVEFYPASFMISHHVRPLFYSDTKLMNLVTTFEATSPGPKLTMNKTCSLEEKIYFDKILHSIHSTLRSIIRLLALPGLTNLIECDSYAVILRTVRYFQVI